MILIIMDDTRILNNETVNKLFRKYRSEWVYCKTLKGHTYIKFEDNEQFNKNLKI